MANGLTGSMIIANLGLLKNKGLAINQSLEQAINNFTSSNISGSVQRIVTNASPALIDVLQSAPVCFTGFLPDGVAEPQGSIKTNIPKSILNQANTFFRSPDGTSSVAAFIHIFTLATGYCTQIDGLQRALLAAQGKSFSELGAQFKNYSDIITGGISGQFKVSSLPALASELPNLGKMFSTKVLSEIGNPGALVTNLYDLGLGDVGGLRGMVDENGITLDFVDDTEKTLLLKIFNKIIGNDLTTILNATSFKPARLDDIKSLADVLDINKLFSNAALAAIGNTPTLSMLANKLSNIGGTFSSMADIGLFLSGINVTSFPLMQSLTSLLPDELINDLQASIGKGSGPNGNPLITDVIGCISGTKYTDRIVSLIATQQKLLANDADVRAFKEYLDASSSDTINLTQLQTLIDKIINKSTLINVLNDANQLLINCAVQLNIEKTNIQLANIVPGVAEATMQDIQNFVNTLNKLPAADNLKIVEFLLSIATTDIYGDAIKASIVEGQNLTRMATYGINVGTKLG